MTFYLYRKTHNVTKLNYLGYTKYNPYDYKGSGTYWKNHIKIHGNDVLTEILFETDDIKEIESLGIFYSEMWNIVNSQEWANLQVKSAGNPKITDSTRIKMSASKLGKKFTKEHKKNISESLKGISRPSKPHSQETKNKIGNAHRGKVTSEETKEKIRKKKLGKKLSIEHRQKMKFAQLKRREMERGINV